MTKILAVSPAIESLRALHHFGRAQGHDVYCARSTQAAQTLLSQERVQLILSSTDVDFGAVFGFLRQVKKDPRYNRIPFVMFTDKKASGGKRNVTMLGDATRLLGADKYFVVEHFEPAAVWSQLSEYLRLS